MATRTKQPLAQDALYATYRELFEIAVKERTIDMQVRSDWMQDNDICSHCEGKGTDTYRPTIDYMHDYVTVPCKRCNATGHTSCTGQPVDVMTLFPESAEYTQAMARVQVAHDRFERVKAIESNPRGYTVRVVSGRKVPIGTVGKAFWSGDNRWGMSVGIETSKGRVFTGLHNVRVVFDNEP